ncbi:MAG: TRAP transporter small permease subunit [Proteobacteria bacterium]|nr:TRAP transporter small permease subunit [Pseudomonadota bacterium]
MKGLLKIIDGISEWSGKLFAFLLWPGVGVLVYEVGARHLFDAPTIWAHGTTQRIFAAYYFICGAYISLHLSHINMDVIYSRFSLRTRAILDMIGFLFFFAFCIVLLWWGFGYAWDSLMRLEPDNTPFRAPLYPVKLVIPLGALLIFLQELAQLWRHLYIAITGREYER